MGNSGLSAACLWLVAMEFPVPHVNSASELATSATTASVDIADCLAAPPVHVCDTDNALFIVVPKQSRSGSTSKPVGQCLADQLRNLFQVNGTNDPSASQHTFYSALPAVQMLIRTHEKQCISPEEQARSTRAARPAVSAPWASRLLGAAAFSSARLQGVEAGDGAGPQLGGGGSAAL